MDTVKLEYSRSMKFFSILAAGIFLLSISLALVDNHTRGNLLILIPFGVLLAFSLAFVLETRWTSINPSEEGICVKSI